MLFVRHRLEIYTISSAHFTSGAQVLLNITTQLLGYNVTTEETSLTNCNRTERGICEITRVRAHTSQTGQDQSKHAWEVTHAQNVQVRGRCNAHLHLQRAVIHISICWNWGTRVANYLKGCLAWRQKQNLTPWHHCSPYYYFRNLVCWLFWLGRSLCLRQFGLFISLCSTGTSTGYGIENKRTVLIAWKLLQTQNARGAIRLWPDVSPWLKEKLNFWSALVESFISPLQRSRVYERRERAVKARLLLPVSGNKI